MYVFYVLCMCKLLGVLVIGTALYLELTMLKRRKPICRSIFLRICKSRIYFSSFKILEFVSPCIFIHSNELTLRVLMSYIYIYTYMEHSFLMFLDHTQRRNTVGRTPLDE